MPDGEINNDERGTRGGRPMDQDRQLGLGRSRAQMNDNARTRPMLVADRLSPVQLPITIVTVHTPDEGPSIQQMVAGARNIWHAAGIDIVPEFRTLDPARLSGILIRVIRNYNNELVLPTPDLMGSVRENLRRSGLATIRDDFSYGGGENHPWSRLRRMVHTSTNRILVFFIKMEHGVGYADRTRSQVYIASEAQYSLNDFFRTSTTMPTGRTLAHELGHILLATGRHPQEGRHIPTSGLMRQGSPDITISESDKNIARRNSARYITPSGRVLWMDRGVNR